jgi:hypothetical protein
MQVKTVSPQQVLAKAIELLESCGLDNPEIDSAVLNLVELSRSLPSQVSVKEALPPFQSAPRVKSTITPEIVEAARVRMEDERKADLKRVNERKRKRRKLLEGKKPVLTLDELFT